MNVLTHGQTHTIYEKQTRKHLTAQQLQLRHIKLTSTVNLALRGDEAQTPGPLIYTPQ